MNCQEYGASIVDKMNASAYLIKKYPVDDIPLSNGEGYDFREFEGYIIFEKISDTTTDDAIHVNAYIDVLDIRYEVEFILYDKYTMYDYSTFVDKYFSLLFNQ